MFDAIVYLDVYDKILPGLIIAMSTLSHLLTMFVSVRSMTSGLSNNEQVKARSFYNYGKLSRAKLL